MAQNEDVQVRVKLALENAEASKSVAEYTRSLRALKGLALEIGDSNSQAFEEVQSAIGAARDRMNDLNDSINALSGSPIENISSSLGQVGGSLSRLDFGGAINGARSLNTAFRSFKLSDLTNEFKQLLITLGALVTSDKASVVAKQQNTAATIQNTAANRVNAASMNATTVATEGATVATNAFSLALKGTGILLLVGAVVALIANFDKLKESGGFLGTLLSGIANIVTSLKDGLIALSDAFGFTNTKVAEQKKKQEELNAILKEGTIKNYDRIIKLLQDLGADNSVISQLKAQEELNQATDAYSKKLEELTKKEKDAFSSTTKNIDELRKKISENRGAPGDVLGIWEWELQMSEKSLPIIIRDLGKITEEVKKNNPELIKLAQEREDKITKINEISNAKYIKLLRDNNLMIGQLNSDEIKNQYEKQRVKNNLALQEEKNAAALSKSLRDIALKQLDEEKKKFAEYSEEWIKISEQILKINQQTTQEEKELAIKSSNTRKENNKLRIEEQQNLAKNTLEILKTEGQLITLEDAKQSDERLAKQKDNLGQQIKFIQDNINKLFPLDPNLPSGEAARKQNAEARRVIEGIKVEYATLGEKQLELERRLYTEKLLNEAELQKLKAKTLDETFDADKKSLEAKWLASVQIADYSKMSAEEIANIDLSNAVKKAQYERDLHSLVIKNSQAVEALNLKQLEDRSKAARAIANADPGSLSKELEALRLESRARRDQMQLDFADELAMADKLGQDKFAIIRKYNAMELENSKQTEADKLKARTDAVNRGLQVAQYGSNLLSSINELATTLESRRLKDGEKLSVEIQKKQFIRGQALAAVSAAINTAQAVTQALASLPPPASFIAAAAAGASGAIQIAAILAKKFTPDSPSTSADSASVANVGSAPSSAQTNISTPTLFGLGNFQPFNAPGSALQKVYVLESDITRAQDNVRQVQVSATF